MVEVVPMPKLDHRLQLRQLGVVVGATGGEGVVDFGDRQLRIVIGGLGWVSQGCRPDEAAATSL